MAAKCAEVQSSKKAIHIKTCNRRHNITRLIIESGKAKYKRRNEISDKVQCSHL